MGLVVYDRTGSYTGYLGNVMFQTASTIGIALKNNMQYAFPHKSYFDCFSGYIPIYGNTHELIDYQEKAFHYEDIQLNASQNYNLKGYFQSWKYFDHCSDLIKKTFTFNEQTDKTTQEKYQIILKVKSKGIRLCFIHVRRGDYLSYPDHHPVLDMNYYNAAMDMIKKACDYRCLFMIFSNDEIWCRNNFLPNTNFYFVSKNEQDIDLCLMSKCDHGIIANSSMSWWGSELIDNPLKIIIAPRQWWGSAYAHYNTKGIYRKHWLLLCNTLP